MHTPARAGPLPAAQTTRAQAGSAGGAGPKDELARPLTAGVLTDPLVRRGAGLAPTGVAAPVQRRFLELAEGKPLKTEGTALERVWAHPLTAEIEKNPDWVAGVKFVSAGFAANGEYVPDGPDKVVWGARLELPGPDTDKGEEVQKGHDVSTLHELVHARAIFNKEFHVAPRVIHSLYEKGALKAREVIPLEEAVTVGFRSEGETVHMLHAETTLADLATLGDEQLEKFAGKGLAARYKRIYLSDLAGEKTTAHWTENAVRASGKGLPPRQLYEATTVGKDEGWAGGLQASTQGFGAEQGNIASDIATWRRKLDEGLALGWDKVQERFKEDEDFAFSFLANSVEKPKTFATWKETLNSFKSVLERLEPLVTEARGGGNVQDWARLRAAYQKASEIGETALDYLKKV